MNVPLIACVLAITLPVPLSGQAPLDWSVEAVIGGGRHTERAGMVYYNTSSSPMARFAVSVGANRNARMSPYAKVEYSPHLTGDRLAICRIAPNGSCQQYFDDHNGVGVGIGMRGALSTATSLRALVGFGKYGGRTRGFVEGEAALRVTSHVGLVSTGRYMRWSQQGAPHWFAPITVGLQLF